MARYSASADDQETTYYFFDFQGTRAPPKRTSPSAIEMTGRLTKLIVFLSVCLTALVPADANVKSLFVFGDSQLDPGNNQRVKNCMIRANFTPYGSSFFHYPTGRFTNGRTVADFISQFLGIKFQKPYQEVKRILPKKGTLKVKKGSLKVFPPNGLNFASAGSGLLSETNKDKGATSLKRQVKQFQSLIAKKHLHKKQIHESLFIFASGASDVFSYFLFPGKSKLTPKTYVHAMLKEVVRFIGKVYKYGGRKILISSIGPTECVPARVGIKGASANECFNKLNKMVRYYNAGLKRIVYTMPRRYPRTIILYGALYDTAKKFMKDPKQYGFADVTHACCGGGPLNGVVPCGLQGYTMCWNPSGYLFWDGFHPSERTYGLVSESFWAGGPKEIWPMNLKTLAHNITFPVS